MTEDKRVWIAYRCEMCPRGFVVEQIEVVLGMSPIICPCCGIRATQEVQVEAPSPAAPLTGMYKARLAIDGETESLYRKLKLLIGKLPPGKYSLLGFDELCPEIPALTLPEILMALSDDPDVNLKNIDVGWWKIDD